MKGWIAYTRISSLVALSLTYKSYLMTQFCDSGQTPEFLGAPLSLSVLVLLRASKTGETFKRGSVHKALGTAWQQLGRE